MRLVCACVRGLHLFGWKIVSDRIHIGDEWVRVGPGYIRAEEEYTRELSNEWYAKVYRGEIDEDLRQKILDKRVEFHTLVEEGKITITPPEQKRTWWGKMWRKIIG